MNTTSTPRERTRPAAATLPVRTGPPAEALAAALRKAAAEAADPRISAWLLNLLAGDGPAPAK